jgi:hypothetical protein
MEIEYAQMWQFYEMRLRRPELSAFFLACPKFLVYVEANGQFCLTLRFYKKSEMEREPMAIKTVRVTENDPFKLSPVVEDAKD